MPILRLNIVVVSYAYYCLTANKYSRISLYDRNDIQLYEYWIMDENINL